MKKYIQNPSLARRARLWMMMFLLLVMSNLAFAQTIQVLNIPDGNRKATDSSNPQNRGYHLNGTFTSNGANMINAKAKLTSSANFGPSGTVNRQLVITDGFGSIGSITNISQLNTYDIIYIGVYTNNFQSPFTPTEVSILLQWSKQPGKVLMVQEQAMSNPISTAMGYGITSDTSYPNTSALAADNEQNTKLFSGVFGNVSGTISQNGTSQGYFSAGCAGIPIAKNDGNFPTIILNQEYRDILVADTDYFTYLSYYASSPISSSTGISTNADKVWANLWAWAVNEVVNQVAPSTVVTVGGEAYSDDLPICTGSSITVKLRNNNAAVRNWETSTNNGASWTSIASTANSITYANPVANQQFRAVVGNPGCTANSSSVVVTVFNASAPAVTSSLSNVCPASTVNLDSAQTGTKPAGTNLVWFTNNTHSGTALTAAQVANAGAGTYYAFYQSTSNTNCYSAASNAVTVTINTCPVLSCSGTANIPPSGTFTVNGVTITSSYTGDVKTYTSGPFNTCSSDQLSNNSLWVGQNSPWSLTLNFSKPVNNVVLLLGATGHTYNENFIFNSNGGTVSIYSDSPANCLSTINGNEILSGASTTGGDGGGRFRISAPSNFTTLTINGAGGQNGSLMGFCSSSIVAGCNAGTTQVPLNGSTLSN